MIKNYKQYIVEQVDHDSPVLRLAKKQGKSYDQITILHCSSNQLTSLEGIENLVNLQVLYCSYNQLTNLKGIENLANLQILFCYNNQLTSLEGVENLVNLQELYCYNNQLNSLKGIEKLANLQQLYCFNNQLTSLEFGDFSIEAFEIGIDETDLRRFKKLNFLGCAKNKFSERYKKYLENYCERKRVDLLI